MATLLLESPMARSPEPDPKKSPVTSTKFDRELIRKANVIAGARKIELFEYLDALNRPLIERDYARFIKGEAAGLDDA